MVSCIYQGIVRHERLKPVQHRFQYRHWMLYLDLSELEMLRKSCPLLSNRRFSPLSFLRSDHLGDPQIPLADWVRERVRCDTGLQLNGPIRLLTQLRQWGKYFSPLNLYFCWDHPEGNLAAVLAEVSNIPWQEKHAYVLWEGNRQAHRSGLQFENEKSFHVSPFMGMEQSYHWNLQEPGGNLRIAIRSQEAGESLFHASLDFERTSLSSRALAWQIFRQPLPTAQIVAAIYYQAFQLWWKKCPVYAHPGQRSPRPQKLN